MMVEYLATSKVSEGMLTTLLKPSLEGPKVPDVNLSLMDYVKLWEEEGVPRQ